MFSMRDTMSQQMPVQQGVGRGPPSQGTGAFGQSPGVQPPAGSPMPQGMGGMQPQAPQAAGGMAQPSPGMVTPPPPQQMPPQGGMMGGQMNPMMRQQMMANALRGGGSM